jgi:ribosomal protein S30
MTTSYDQLKSGMRRQVPLASDAHRKQRKQQPKLEDQRHNERARLRNKQHQYEEESEDLAMQHAHALDDMKRKVDKNAKNITKLQKHHSAHAVRRRRPAVDVPP